MSSELKLNALNFNSIAWKNLISQAVHPNNKHPYICFNQLTNDYYLSDDQKNAHKLSLRQITQITDKYMSGIDSKDSGEISAGLQKMKLCSEAKLNAKPALVRFFVRICQCVRNAFSGLGFQTQVSALEKLCLKLSAKIKPQAPEETNKDLGNQQQIELQDSTKIDEASKDPSVHTIVNQTQIQPTPNAKKEELDTPKIDFKAFKSKIKSYLENIDFKAIEYKIKSYLENNVLNPPVIEENQNNFKALVKDLQPKEIFELAKNDCFSLQFSFPIFNTHPITIIFESLSSEQFKAFLEGTFEIKTYEEMFLYGMLTSIVKMETAKKHFITDLLVQIIDKHEKSQSLWESVKITNSCYIDFVRSIVVKGLKDENYNNLLKQIYKLCPIVFEKAVQLDFCEEVNFEEWQKAYAWGIQNNVQIEQMPEELLEFKKIQGDQAKEITFLKKLCANVIDPELNLKLKLLLKEVTSADIAIYAKNNAFNVEKNSDEYVPVIRALKGEKLRVFLEETTSMPGFGINFLENVKNKLWKFSHNDEIKELVEVLLKQLKSKEFLEEFKKIRKNKEVKDLIKKALGNKTECHIELIVNEMTVEEIKLYVTPKNDYFNIKAYLQLGVNDPLVGLVKSFSLEKLKVFLEAVFNRNDCKYSFFKHMLALISETNADIKLPIYNWISDLVSAEEKFQDWFQGLDPSEAEFAAHYLALALDKPSHELLYRLDVFYKKNHLLFFSTELQDALYSISVDKKSKIYTWLLDKKASEPVSLVATIPMDASFLNKFEEFRENPAKVKAFLDFKHNKHHSGFTEYLKALSSIMTKEEVFLYANKSNNCFDILPSTNRYKTSKKKSMELIFECFDGDNLEAYVSSTVQRSDLDMAAYVLLLINSYKKSSPLKEKLLTAIMNHVFKEHTLDKFYFDAFEWKAAKDDDVELIHPLFTMFGLYFKALLQKGETAFKQFSKSGGFVQYCLQNEHVCKCFTQHEKDTIKKVLQEIERDIDLSKFSKL